MVLTVKIEPDLHHVLVNFAAVQRKTKSELARELLRVALEGEGAELVERDLADRGYQAGFRRGRQDFYDAMAKVGKEK